MRLFGLISWYDEPTETLARCVVGLARAGVSHVIAVDGAYALYPDGEPVSHSDQHGAIHTVCKAMGMELTLYMPSELWANNEVEKRSFMHKLAYDLSGDRDDWHIVMDADQVVLEVPEDFEDRLLATDRDVIDVMCTERGTRFTRRLIFRGDSLVRLHTNHFTYVTEDDRVLWAAGNVPQEEALEVHDFLVDHRTEVRSNPRTEKRLLYYAARDSEGVEMFQCQFCDDGRASTRLPHGWHMTVEHGPAADWVEVCEECAVRVRAENVIALKKLGANDPEKVVIRQKHGKLPPHKARANIKSSHPGTT